MRRIQPTKNQRGTTLAELLAYLGVTSILFITLTTFVANLGQGIRRNAVQRELTEVGRTALSAVSNEIRRAQKIDTVTADTVKLFRPNGTETGELITISFAGNALTLNDNSGTKPLNGNDVRMTAVAFEKIGDCGATPTSTCSVEIDLTVAPTVSTPGISPLDLASVATVRRLYY